MDKAAAESTAAPIVFSVIVPSVGRVDLLSRCLDHLAALRAPSAPWEVLVMDTAEDDRKPAVRETAAEFSQRIRRLRYVALPPHGLMLGRHRGVEEARGEIVSFLDDDSFVGAEWLQGIEEAFQRPDVAMAGGPNLPLFEDPPPAWLDYFWIEEPDGRYLLDLSLLDYGPETREVSPGMIWGCNLSIRKDLFLKIGGSHPDCIPAALQRFQGDGETGLTTRAAAAGLRALYCPKIKIHHFVLRSRMTVEYFRQRAFYQGVCDSFTDIRRKHGFGPRLGVPSVRRSARRSLARALWLCRNKVEIAARKWASYCAESGKAYRAYLSVKREVARGHREGYDFHRREVARDPALLAWVLRENYLGAGGIPAAAGECIGSGKRHE